MTDDLELPFGADDATETELLLSALLDGADGEDDLDEVDRARLESMRTIRAQLAQVPPPPPGLADAQVDTAMAAFGIEASAIGDDEPVAARPAEAEVVPLRAPWWRRMPVGAVAAGVAVLALVGVAGIISAGNGSDADGDVTAATTFDGTAADRTDEEMADSAMSTAEALAPAADAAGGTTGGGDDAAGVESVPYGRYPSVDALADDILGRLADEDFDDDRESTTVDDDESPSGETDAKFAADPCRAVALLGLDPEDVRAVVDAFVADVPVTAVFAGDDEVRMIVVTHADCSISIDRTY